MKKKNRIKIGAEINETFSQTHEGKIKEGPNK